MTNCIFQDGAVNTECVLAGAASWWSVVLWVLVGSVAGSVATIGWRTNCSAGHLRELLSSRGALNPASSSHQVLPVSRKLPMPLGPLPASTMHLDLDWCKVECHM